ncbi:hypothetical protein HU200_067359 [Digitaria exilis]|uniref:Uncharacterized protein n=1 Tax=Digitaria exilis TaxID=1010633 RepID=A0A834ZW97_9POAL|nr:hypothetical protein HU200_067359 [Digitaria exilis]
MGNGLSLPPCMYLPVGPAAARVVYWGGRARLITGVITAGDVAAELPAPATDHTVCHADAFFVGLPIPVVPPAEELLPGRTYFVLPASRLPSLKVLTAATLAALSAAASAPAAGGGRRKAAAGTLLVAGPAGQCPFEYVKGADGGAPLVRVLPGFIEKVITCDATGAAAAAPAQPKTLCSTPELRRHYAQLVGPRNRAWSPRLETIAEGDRSRWLIRSLPLLYSR